MRRSPFSIFRENNKVLMVLLTGLAMFAFIIADAFTGGPRGGGGMRVLLPYLLSMAAFGLIFWLVGSPQGRGGIYSIVGVVVGLLFAFLMPTIFGRNYMVSSSVGNLTEAELQERINERQIANRFMVALAQQTMPQLQPQQLQQITFGAYGGLTPAQERQETAHIFVMAREADELGIRVSNQAVSDYLKAVFGEENLTSQAFIEARREIGVSEDALYDILRYHLKARQFAVLSEPRRYVTPAEQWDAFKRMTVTEMLSVAEVPVAAFAGSVKAPSEAELTLFFERYKNNYPQFGLDPDQGAVRPVEAISPVPEFGVPRQIAITYLKADFEKLRAEPKEPTEEQVRAAYYDLLAEERDRRNLGATPDADAPAYAEPDDERFEAARERLTLRVRERNAQEAVFQTQKRIDALMTQVYERMDDLAAEHRRAIEQGSEPDTKKSSAALKKFAEENGLEFEALPALSALEMSATKPVTEEAVAEYYRENREQFPRATFGGPAVAEPSGERGGEDADAWKYRPLSEVRSAIRARLSGRLKYPIALAVTPEVPEKPTESMFHPGVQELNITRDLGDPVVVARLFSERSELLYVPYQAIESQVESNQQFASMLGAPVEERVAVSTGDRYVYWKRADVPAHMPTFKQAREEVVRAWQIKEARPKAQERAKELAKLVRAALPKSGDDATLPISADDAMAGALEGQTITAKGNEPVHVFETGAFRWMEVPPRRMAQRFMPPPPEITSLPQVPKAGEAFMETVFRELEEGEVGVASNADESAYFVVRVDRRSPDTEADWDALRQAFLQSSPDPTGRDTTAAAVQAMNYATRSDVASRWRQQFPERYELDVRVPIGVE